MTGGYINRNNLQRILRSVWVEFRIRGAISRHTQEPGFSNGRNILLIIKTDLETVNIELRHLKLVLSRFVLWWLGNCAFSLDEKKEIKGTEEVGGELS